MSVVHPDPAELPRCPRGLYDKELGPRRMSPTNAGSPMMHAMDAQSCRWALVISRADWGPRSLTVGAWAG